MSQKSPQIEIVVKSRPSIPEYGISEDKQGMVTREDVDQWMDKSKNYWISTTKSNGNPHARPIWGVWYENIFYFGGGQKTQNVRNLLKNSNITVHTESGENVVIVQGIAEQFDDEDLHDIIGKQYEIRYNMFHPPPFWRVIPKIIFAWSMSDFAGSPTKFECRVKE